MPPICEQGLGLYTTRLKPAYIVALFCYLFIHASAHATKPESAPPGPVYIGLDAEFGYIGSTSAQAIQLGMLIAIEEINDTGGVLNNRPLALIEKDSRSVPARSKSNIEEFANHKDLVAVFCGKFSPTVLDNLPHIHRLKIPLLDPWAAADAIIDNGYTPNYVFRLSLSDKWAMAVMLRRAQKKGAKKVGLLLLNTGWGRGNLKVAERFVEDNNELSIADVRWFNWQDKPDSLLDKYNALNLAGADAIILVANDAEATDLVREIAKLPPNQHLPIISHWGITGGDFAGNSGSALHKLDLSVVQTYSFIGANTEKAEYVIQAAQRIQNIKNIRELKSPVGVAHAYDLTHILALAINKAGNTDRAAIRDALEEVKNYRGLIKHYDQPFSKTNHDALSIDDVFMAEYDENNTIVRIEEEPLNMRRH